MALCFATLGKPQSCFPFGHHGAQLDQLHIASKPTRIERARAYALARCVRIVGGNLWQGCSLLPCLRHPIHLVNTRPSLPPAKVRYGVRQLGEDLPQVRLECFAEYDAPHHAGGVHRVALSLAGYGSPQLAQLLALECQRRPAQNRLARTSAFFATEKPVTCV